MNKKNKLNELQELLAITNCKLPVLRHLKYKFFYYSNGVRLFARKGNAYWLLDHLALYVVRNLPNAQYCINLYVKYYIAYLKVYTNNSKILIYKQKINYVEYLESTVIPYKFDLYVFENDKGKKNCILSLPNEE